MGLGHMLTVYPGDLRAKLGHGLVIGIRAYL